MEGNNEIQNLNQYFNHININIIEKSSDIKESELAYVEGIRLKQGIIDIYVNNSNVDKYTLYFRNIGKTLKYNSNYLEVIQTINNLIYESDIL